MIILIGIVIYLFFGWALFLFDYLDDQKRGGQGQLPSLFVNLTVYTFFWPFVLLVDWFCH
jgi:hypothetical protein